MFRLEYLPVSWLILIISLFLDFVKQLPCFLQLEITQKALLSSVLPPDPSVMVPFPLSFQLVPLHLPPRISYYYLFLVLSN